MKNEEKMGLMHIWFSSYNDHTSLHKIFWKKMQSLEIVTKRSRTATFIKYIHQAYMHLSKFTFIDLCHLIEAKFKKKSCIENL